MKYKIKNSLYYFHYKSRYILFKEEKVICRLEEISNGLYYLNIIKSGENYEDYLNLIIEETKNIKKNKYLIRHINHINSKNFYLLINKEWINSKLNNNNNFEKKKLFPQIFKKDNYSYPINFELIEKEDNEEIFKSGEKLKFINRKDLLEKKVIFVYENNLYKKKIYISIIDDNKLYFYLIENDNFQIQFILIYNNEKVLFVELNNIAKKGIEQYLFEASLDLSKTQINHYQNLIDIDLSKIGTFLNFKEINIKVGRFVSHCLYNNSLQISFYGVIQCLLNINFLTELFLDRKSLFDYQINNKNMILTKAFYRLIQNSWYSNNDNTFEESIKLQNLIIELSGKDGKDKIIKNIKLLIEFLFSQLKEELKIYCIL